MSRTDAPVPVTPRAQRGAVLVTSLLLLLVLTIIGVTAMQMSRMQERMAGNSRDMNLAFQGAEAALRQGEDLIRDQNAKPLGCNTAGCAFWKLDAIDQIENRPGQWWDANALEFGAAGAHDMTDLQADPRFVVEELGFVRTDGGVEEGLGPPAGRDFYRVSARSTGGSGLADALLQSTFTRKF